MSPIVFIIVILIFVLAALVGAFFYFGKHNARFTFDIGGQTPKAAGGNDTSSETGFKSRLFGLGIFSGTIIGILIARLWEMQLINYDDYSSQAESNRTRTISVQAPRGRILDRNGNELVSNRSSLCVVAKSDVSSDDIAMQLLANLIGMPKMAVKRKIEDSSEGAQSLRTVAVDVSRRVVAYIDEHATMFDGVTIEQRTQRFYPQGSLCAHVLGYVGKPTEDQLSQTDSDEDSGGTITYESSDTIGQAGVEYQYESVLQGIRGEQAVTVDADGNVLSYTDRVDAEAGNDIVLTIDMDLQKAAETSLKNRIEYLRSLGRTDCNGGSAIALDVTNGEILAMASYPTYTPNVFVGGISNDDWNALSSDEANNPLVNRAISGQYPSASTIKALTSLAALDYGIATASTSYNCTGYWTGFGTGYGQYCWLKTGHGTINLQKGITVSCDVVFYEIGKSFFYSDNSEGMQETFRKWGLGSLTGIDLPGESEGRIPDADWKWNYFTSYSDTDRSWQGGDNTNLAIGQGDLLVTPIQMAAAYAGITQNGSVWRPHVLKSVKSGVGTGSVIDYNSEVSVSVDENQDYLNLVKEGLKGVIYEESEAQASHFTNLTGITVAGKTGSAETNKSQPHGWFIAYAPYEDPKYLVCAMIEYGGYGSEGALNVARDMLGQIYNMPDTSDVMVSVGSQ